MYVHTENMVVERIEHLLIQQTVLNGQPIMMNVKTITQ
jgi:hypothetical protein